MPSAYDGRPSAATFFAAAAYALAGNAVLDPSLATICDRRRPSGIVTVVWIRVVCETSRFQAASAFICLCSRK